MNPRLKVAAGSIARILELIPSGQAPRDYLTTIIDEAYGAVGDQAIAMGVVPLSARRSALASAQRTVELLESVSAVCSRPEGLVDLGVIEWLLRPALLLQNGRFETLRTGPWTHLAPNIAETIARCVCRLDAASPTFGRIHLGTGFGIGSREHGSAIVTNVHVVESAMHVFGWPDRRGVELIATFELESEVAEPHYFNLEHQVCQHPEHDFALLFCACPIPLVELLSAAPDLGRSDAWNVAAVGVIGHPSFDSNVDPFPKLFGFGDLFGVKRFSPGFIKNVQRREWRGVMVDVAIHDASTLSGSSGSCIFDLQTGHVLGLHFGGWPRNLGSAQQANVTSSPSVFEANGGVPLWTLKTDEIFHGLEVKWA